MQVAAKTAVLEDVPDKTKVMGIPAIPFRELGRREVWLNRLPELAKTNRRAREKIEGCHPDPERAEGDGTLGNGGTESKAPPSPRSLAHARDDTRIMMMTIHAIMKVLPHLSDAARRSPFWRSKREEDSSAEERHGQRAVLSGAFSRRAGLPGVLIIEAMAQCGAVLFSARDPRSRKEALPLRRVDKARFRKARDSGDQLIFECEVLQQRSSTVKIRGVARVGGAVVAEAEMLSIMADKPE